MRMSRDAMARHHDEIITAASQMLRERGVEGLSVVDLMKSVGLTHGGFYRHFKSKDALVAEATAATFKSIQENFDATAKDHGPAYTLKGYISYYLSADHVNAPEQGCPLPGFGGDIGREGREVRAAFAKGFEPMLANIASGLQCPNASGRSRAIELICLMSGAVLAARASNDPEQVADILSTARARATTLINSVD